MTWHGIEPEYVRGDTTGRTLRELASRPLRLDRDGVLAAWGVRDDPFATVVAGVRRAPTRARRASATAWVATFEAAVAEIARSSRDPVLALGGGVDAAAVLVAWRATGRAMPATCTLATGLADYDELEVTLEIARTFGVRCDAIDARPDELVALVPEAVAVAETPLYNLHPVHRLALARAVRNRGGATLVTGDGADAVFAGAPDLDYVPIVAALTRAANLALRSAFFDNAVIDCTQRDPSKRAVRDYLRSNDLGWLADCPKRSRWVPPLDLAPILDRDRIARLARDLDLPPNLADDRGRVGWATLDHLARSLA